VFDSIFNDSVSNHDVFKSTIHNMLPKVLEGYNFTSFAYGMTGAGKTHTMLGDIYGNSTGERGICFLTVEKLFELIHQQTSAKKEFEVKISYLEIYNE